MIVGDVSRFAIESSITTAYASLGMRALGSFTIHLGGIRYGVPSDDASALACSFDAVERRLRRRGRHLVHFATSASGGDIADAVIQGLYAPGGELREYFGTSRIDFVQSYYESGIQWAPDGDEAFDDGSFVLQFDLEDCVRLVAFKFVRAYTYDRATLRDVHLGAPEFYGVLERWRAQFESEWAGRVRDDAAR